MQARITRFKMKAESVEAAAAQMQSLKPDILALPGMRHFLCAINPDGSGYTIAVIGPEGTSPESVDRVRAVWSKFADHLEAMPRPEIYEVAADWPT